MRLDLQLSGDQERQLLESCVLHEDMAPSGPRRSSRSSFSGGIVSPMRRSVSGPLRGVTGLGGHPFVERQTSFAVQNPFPAFLPPHPQSLPAIQVRRIPAGPLVGDRAYALCQLKPDGAMSFCWLSFLHIRWVTFLALHAC